MERQLDVFERVVALQREGLPFVLAIVVARRAPVSAHIGDHAIVFGDGHMDGFIGGACARELIRQQALQALRLRQGRLVSIRPDPADAPAVSDEHIVVPMTCASEGAVDVYLEPFVRPSALLIVGATPVANALAKLARAMDYAVTRVVDGREYAEVAAASRPIGAEVITLDGLEAALTAGPADRAVIVASQGHYDEEALESILRAGLPYIGLLASRQRGATVRARLDEKQLPGVDGIHSPVGLDIGARTPQDVALSILAEIVHRRPKVPAEDVGRTAGPAAIGGVALDGVALDGAARDGAESDAAAPTFATDPVCGMQVEIATVRHTAEVDGIAYYFCCPHCRDLFVKQPQAFLQPAT